jgi:hypothetical protein
MPRLFSGECCTVIDNAALLEKEICELCLLDYQTLEEWFSDSALLMEPVSM